MSRMPRAASGWLYPNSIHRQREPAFISAILIVGIYLCFYNLPLFCQHEDLASNNIANDAGIKSDADGKWFIINSANFTIYCKQEVNLGTVERRLGRRGLFISGVYGPNPVSAPPQKVAYRMDRILKRVKDILEMYPGKMDLKIRVFNTREELNDEYYNIFGQWENYKSFYIHKYKTIYTSEEDVSDSIMAHEMGHAVVDHYFNMIPPGKIREILASYVDKHLEE